MKSLHKWIVAMGVAGVALVVVQVVVRPITVDHEGGILGFGPDFFWSESALGAWSTFVKRSREHHLPHDGLNTKFLGVTSVSLTLGKESIVMDGYVSRLSFLKSFIFKNVPDLETLRGAHQKLDGARVLAVLVGHTHLDHYFDAPKFAKLTGAKVVGGRSVLSARTLGPLEADDVIVTESGDELDFGPFRVHVFNSEHSPGDRVPGEMPLKASYPLRVTDLKCGENRAYFVVERSHEKSRGVLFHPSAGYVPGQYKSFFRDRPGPVLFLAVGNLGHQSEEYCAHYWKEVVRASHPSRVILTHWDDFFSAPNRYGKQQVFPLMRPVFDRIDRALECIKKWSEIDGTPVEVRTSDQSFSL